MPTKKENRKKTARILTLHCFRNTFLEDIHAGTFPSSRTGDYSDVKVVSPYGEIPWNELGRISDEEMKKLMIEVIDNVYTFLTGLDEGFSQGSLNWFMMNDDMPSKEWKQPSISKKNKIWIKK